jgi:hypothetical protein
LDARELISAEDRMAPRKMMMETMKYRYETISREAMNAEGRLMTSISTRD